MKRLAAIRSFKALLVLAGLILLAVSVHAENWVRVHDEPGDPSFINIDVDSIRKSDDGLVYYNAEEDMGSSPSAADCSSRTHYVIGDGSSDWKGRGRQASAGSTEAKELDLVCA
jgi:hypothetical protein